MYKVRIVDGTFYYMKISMDDQILHAKVFKPLPHMVHTDIYIVVLIIDISVQRVLPYLIDVKPNMTEESELDPWED